MTKHLILLFILALTATGCSYNENDLVANPHQTEDLGHKGHFNDFKELSKLFDDALPDYKNGRHSNAKVNAISIYDFKIDSVFVTQKIDPTGTFYTMAIYRDSIYDNFVENLVLRTKDGVTDAFIVTYFPDSAYEKKQNAQYHFTGGVHVAKIDKDKIGSVTPKFGGVFCMNIRIVLCDYSYTHVAGKKCTDTYTGTTLMCMPSGTGDFTPSIQPMQIVSNQNGIGWVGGIPGPAPYTGDYSLILNPQLTLSNQTQFKRLLTAAQRAFYNLPANAAAVASLRNYINSRPEYNLSIQIFAQPLLNLLMQTGNTALANELVALAYTDLESAQQIINYLVEEGFSEESQDFADEILNLIAQNPPPTYTSSDYPGMNNGMPYEWWRNEAYIQENIRIPSDNPNAAVDAPNILELLLFRRFPARALLHVENSVEALNRTDEIVQLGIYTHPHNGKADAFRHTYWNALDAAEIGVFFAKVFTDAHEWNSGNHLLESSMDFHNNGVGRLIGENYSFTTDESVIEATVHTFMGNGTLKYLSPLDNNEGDNILSNTEILFTNQ